MKLALDLAIAQIDEPDMRSLGWLVAKILGDDVEQSPPGRAKFAKARPLTGCSA